MANSIQLARASLIFLRHNQTFFKPFKLNFKTFTIKPPNSHLYSTTATPYPLQYDMIVSSPANSPPPASRRRRPSPPLNSRTPESAEQNPDSELGFNDWVDQKLLSTSSTEQQMQPNLDKGEMDKSKRKYYNKREKRMYGGSGGSDSDNEGNSREGSKFVEMKQEVVELRTLHKKEEELYFYDAFAYPWEKDKHYKMVYQLEKKFFPDQGFDKAFLEPGQSNTKNAGSKNSKWVGDKGDERKDEKGMVFFEEESKSEDKEEVGLEKEVKMEVTEKKVEEFFKCLKKVPNKDGEVTATGPFLSSRSGGLPPKWDSPTGTVALINKPKGWTSFTVCGKLRRVVNVKKVGHAGTLDPMATGLLIVCVGKATKLMESYQGMIKGYSGVIRLGEATSTLDADSPVIQREPWEHIKDEDIRKAATSFCGEIWQVPPMFSAIKVGGERMYEKARRGESIELAPRRISIYNFDLERSLDDRQNVIFKVTCSKGTYIRSLCADLAKALGSCAHLTALRRDSIGEYSADDAWEFKELEEAVTKGYL